MAHVSTPDPPQAVVPLVSGDVANLPISWRSRLSEAEIKHCLVVAPGRSVWNRETSEYAVVGPWRNRPEISQVLELAAIQNPEEMLTGAAMASAEAGAQLTVVVEIDEKRSEAFYARVGFEHLEKVITYRIDARRAPAIRRDRNLVFRTVHPFDELVMAELIALDHRAFPWLWWNCEAEFLNYAIAPGVEMLIGYADGVPVSYAGVTKVDDWGHIDRIAVDPSLQGLGYGMQTLSAAVNSMAARSVRTIGLSTQSTNERSRRLYHRFGFERTRDSDYDLWGDTRYRAPGLELQRSAGR